jgi:hypothetical protein
MSPNMTRKGLLPAKTFSALGGTRTPNLLIRSHFRGVSAGLGGCRTGAVTWTFLGRAVTPRPAWEALCRTIR